MPVTYLLNDSVLNLFVFCLFFCQIVWYWDRVTSNEKCSSNLTVEVQIVCGKFQRFNVINRCIEMLKLVEVSKISIKIKNCKTFCKAQRANRLKKFILERLDKYKNFVCLKYYFQKKNSRYEILNNLYVGSNFVFLGIL